jgi:hypothetical protein
MTLMRAVLRRLWRLTRATSMVVGLAAMLALVAGVSSLAVAGTSSGGETAAVILKGASNVETTTTTLINRGLGAALSLRVRPGSPPLTVNADAGTVTNLSADKLDGEDSTEFVSAIDGKAPDADKLDGKDSTDFAPAGTATAYTARTASSRIPNNSTDFVVASKNVPAGSYAINAKVSLENVDDDDVANAYCKLTTGGTTVDLSSLQTPGINTGAQELDAVGNSEEIPLQGVAANFGGGTIALNCWEFSNSDRVDANNAVVTAIRVGSVQ